MAGTHRSARTDTHTQRGSEWYKAGLQWQLPSVGLRVSSWVLQCIISLCRQAYYFQHIYTYVPAQQHVINTEWWVLCWSVSGGVIMKSEVWANPLIRNVSYQQLFIITQTHAHKWVLNIFSPLKSNQKLCLYSLYYL